MFTSIFSARRRVAFYCLALACVLSARSLGASGDIMLNAPGYPFFHATGMDQPRLYGLLTDGDGQVIEDDDGPVPFRAFIDTGSSGFVLSNLHVDPELGERVFGFSEANGDFIGQYTNLGLGGEEVGWVTREVGVRLLNQPESIDTGGIDDFLDYGTHRLWVRQQPGIGEVVNLDLGSGIIYPLISPVNIVGMPVISQRAMVMEWKEVGDMGFLLPEGAKELQTRLVPFGDPSIPPTNLTIELAMREFVSPAPGETPPGFARNPLVKNVTIRHDPEKPPVTADWLFDTGAGSSFISLDFAKAIGLIPETYADLPAYVEDHLDAGGMISQVGGIGPETITVPILETAEIRVPTRGGRDLVWQNVRVMVFDHPDLADLGLEGIFGMNLIGPAATIDSSLLDGIGLEGDVGAPNNALLDLLFALLSDITPGPFDTIVFEVTGEETGELRLFRPGLPQSFQGWLDAAFTPAELADATVTGPAADPGGHGIPMLARYAFGMDARQPDPRELPKFHFDAGENSGDETLVLTAYRRNNDPVIQMVVEVSSDLRTWENAGASWVTVEVGEQRVRREAWLPPPTAGESGRYYRVRVVAEN